MRTRCFYPIDVFRCCAIALVLWVALVARLKRASAQTATAQTGAANGLVAYYTFDEGGGDVAVDHSRGHHNGRINGCLFVKSDRGFALDVNGVGDGSQAVDCGDVDITGALTLSCWVYAYAWEPDWSGLVYKSDATYGIRNSARQPGRLHFRAGGRDLISNGTLRPQTWYHLVAVYQPSRFLRLYVNGALDQEILNEVPAAMAEDDAPLRLGTSGKAHFKGRLDEVRVYNRALSANEVTTLFVREGGTVAKARPERKMRGAPLFRAQVPSNKNVALNLYAGGGLELVNGGERYLISATYSAPGARRNSLRFVAKADTESENLWRPQVVRKSASLYEVRATGRHYRLVRRISLLSGKIRIDDTFLNTTKAVIGIKMHHAFETVQPLRNWRLFGVEGALSPPDPRTPAINPTCFLSQPKTALGIVIEDDVLRNQLEATPRIGQHTIELGSRHFGLAAGARYTTSYTLYTGTQRYFDFINRVRADWKVQSASIPGPAAFLRADSWDSGFFRDVLEPHPDQFKTFLKRKNLKVFLVCPWFRYWDGFDYSDEQYKQRMQQIIRCVKAVEPEAKLLACLETYYYFLPRAQFGDTLPQDSTEWGKQPYQMSMPAAANEIINATAWKDSLYRDPQGRAIVSPHDPGADTNYKIKPLCLMVYPTLDNHFFRQRRREIDFLLDEVGFDGVYMDMFGYGGEYTFECWDGHTVDIDAAGQVVRRYAHLALLTAPARRAWLEHIHRKGKMALVNFGQPNTQALRNVPYFSYLEGADIGHVDLKAARPDASGVAGAQLSTPLSLGGGHGDSDAATANARLRAFLRYGTLYYHYYAQSLFPTSGEGSGEYGAFNHMFPLTPRRLFEGGIEGAERTLSTVSGTFFRPGAVPPQVLLFDDVGRLKPNRFKTVPVKGGWQVQVKLRDWHEVAVLVSPPIRPRTVVAAKARR